MEPNDYDYLILEYNNIKQEIFTMMSRMDQLIILEYTISVAFLSVSLKEKQVNIIMLNLLLVIGIQELVNTRRRHLARATVYIQEIIEKNIKGLNWEKIVEMMDEKYRDKYLYKNFISKIFFYLVNNVAVVISIVSAILYYHMKKTIASLDLVFCFLLLVCLWQGCCYSNFTKLKERYLKILKEI